MLLQNPDDLLFRKAATLHALVLVVGQNELQTGLSPRGKVNAGKVVHVRIGYDDARLRQADWTSQNRFSDFQIHGVDAGGQVVVRRQVKRRYVVSFFEKLSPIDLRLSQIDRKKHFSGASCSSNSSLLRRRPR